MAHAASILHYLANSRFENNAQDPRHKIKEQLGRPLEKMGELSLPCAHLDSKISCEHGLPLFSKIKGNDESTFMPVYYFVLDDAEALPPYRISELGGKEMVYSSEELKMYIRSGRLYETFKDNKCQVGFEQHEVTRQMYLYLPSDIPVFEDDYSLGTKKNFDQLALFLALLSTKGQKPLLDLEQDKPEIIEAYGNAQVLGRAQILAKGISGNHIAPDPEDPEPQAWSEYAINW